MKKWAADGFGIIEGSPKDFVLEHNGRKIFSVWTYGIQIDRTPSGDIEWMEVADKAFVVEGEVGWVNCLDGAIAVATSSEEWSRVCLQNDGSYWYFPSA